MVNPPLRHDFVDASTPPPNRISAVEYNLNAERTDAAYDYAQGGTAAGEAVRTATDAAAQRAAMGAGTASTKADVGLGNVDNTSDQNKPISAAAQAALNMKASSAQMVVAELVSRMTMRPTITRRSLMGTLIGDLITAGVWGKLDGLYVLAANNEQAAKLNWVGAGMQDLTAVNAPTFQIDRGFTGDGAASYLDTNTVMSALEKFTPNNATLGLYVRTNVSSSSQMDIGSDAPTYMNVNNGGNVNARVNSSGGTAITVSNGGNPTGLFAWSRNASNASIFRAGSLLGTAAVANGSYDSGAASSLTILKRSTNYSTRQIAAVVVGSELSGAEHGSLNTALSTYLTAVGAAV